jgi:hypothetical protein
MNAWNNLDLLKRFLIKVWNDLVATLQHEVGNGESEAAEWVAKFGSGHPVDDRSNDGTKSSAEGTERSERFNNNFFNDVNVLVIGELDT